MFYFLSVSPKEFLASISSISCRIGEFKGNHSPEEVFRIYMSGASAGHLNPEFYEAEVDDDHVSRLAGIIRKSPKKHAVNGNCLAQITQVYLRGCENDEHPLSKAYHVV